MQKVAIAVTGPRRHVGLLSIVRCQLLSLTICARRRIDPAGQVERVGRESGDTWKGGLLLSRQNWLRPTLYDTNTTVDNPNRSPNANG